MRIVNVGEDLILDGKILVHVQDRCCLNLLAKVGVVDENGLVWDTKWVSWDRLSTFFKKKE